MNNKTVMTVVNTADVQAILDIEYDSYHKPLGRAEIENLIRNKSNYSKCVRNSYTNEIFGYMFYKVNDENGLEIINLTVKPSSRRQNVGRRLISYLTDNKCWTTVECGVEERNLVGQLFLKACGFKCVQTFKDEDGQTVYFFVYAEGK